MDAPATYISRAAKLARAHTQLRALVELVGHVHGLGYDRPGIRYDQHGGRSAEITLPVRLLRDGRPTGAADDAWGRAYLEAAVHIATADQQLADAITRAGQRRTPLGTHHITRHGVAPAPDFLARVCMNTAESLHLVAPLLRTIDRKGMRLVDNHSPRGALQNIARAVELLPDTRNPDPPITCRNPDRRDKCTALPLYDKQLRLCESCYHAGQYQQRKSGAGKTRKKTRRRKR